MKILVTAFDPFGEDKINPATEAVKTLPDQIAGAEVIKLEIPTVFVKSAEVVSQAIADHQPDYVVNVGQAGGRYALTPERVAINWDDARIADNEGKQPIDQPIQADGPAAYFSSLPIKAMVAAIKEAQLPAEVSNTAGTFVCNHIMYQTLYLIDKTYPEVKGAGFIHLPHLPEHVVDRPNTPSMGLTDISRGLEAAISAIVAYDGKEDLHSVGGKTH